MGKKKQPTGIEQAVEKAATQKALADALGVTQQAVSRWLAQGFVPQDRAREIEMQFGVPRVALISPKLRHLAETGSGL
jgi:DNA-binding transcriptional regulator YdaS (Cro superfamily)